MGIGPQVSPQNRYAGAPHDGFQVIINGRFWVIAEVGCQGVRIQWLMIGTDSGVSALAVVRRYEPSDPRLM
jgi:hypothetical protein